MKCNHCGNKAEFVDNSEVYGRTFGRHSTKIWLCRDCDAYIGVHLNDPNRPLGKRLAKKELRKRKQKVKGLFIIKLLDGNWNSPRHKKREAYKKLAQGMNISENNCHFGDFEMDDLNKAYKFLSTL